MRKIIYLLLLLIAATLAFVLISNTTSDTGDQVQQTPTQETERGVNDIDFSPSTEADNVDTEAAKATGKIDSETTTQSNVSINIVRTSLDEPDLTVGSAIAGVENGECEVRVEDDSLESSSSAAIIGANGTYGCTAQVDISGLSDTSTWVVTVSLISDNMAVAQSAQTITPGSL